MASNDVLDSDSLHDCDPCKITSKEEKDAVIYCPDCKEYLCANCKVYHEKLEPTRQHVPQILIPPNQLSKTSTTAAETTTTTIAAALKGAWIGKKRTQTAKIPDLSLQFDAALDTDKKPCYVTGILVLDKIIVIIDHANEAIKVFDRLKYSSKYQCTAANALNVKKIKPDEMVVTSAEQNFLAIYTINDKSATMKTKINTRLPCWGLCYNAEQNLIYVVCTERKGKGHVAVYTLTGELTRRIEPLQDGLLAFKFPSDIAINQKDKRIYITDGEKGILILSPSGKFESVVSPKELRGAHGLDIDKNGQAYITGVRSSNVFVLPPGGREAKLLLSEDIIAPECLVVEGKQLMLGCRHTNLVKIFTFP